MLSHPLLQPVRARSAASAAEDYSAKPIATAVGGVRILFVAEALSPSKKLLLLLRGCVDSVLDQFQQHAILAQLSARGQALACFARPGGRLTLWRPAF